MPTILLTTLNNVGSKTFNAVFNSSEQMCVFAVYPVSSCDQHVSMRALLSSTRKAHKNAFRVLDKND